MTANLFKMAVPACAALIAMASMAEAGRTVYECSTNARDRGFIPKQVIVAHNDGAGSAMVNDPIIHHFMGKPVSAKVTKNNAKIISFKWVVKTKNKKHQTADMIYRATIRKSDSKLSISAVPPGYSNTFNASGSCKTS